MPRRGHVPIRTCIVCGKKAPKKRLLRIALAGRCRPVWDLSQRLYGRGAYVCPMESCIRRVRTNYKGCLNRAFRMGFGPQDLLGLQDDKKITEFFGVRHRDDKDQSPRVG